MSAVFEALRAEGGTVAEVLADEPVVSEPDVMALLAARGPRARGHEAEYQLLIELILEGSRLHYGGARAVVTDDSDLALLLGDQLYALGLSRLAELGDLEAIAELADVISLVAQAQLADDAALSEAIWEAGAVAVGWGSSEAHGAAKALARAGDPRAAAALGSAAQAVRS
jgi:hypothetical protein